MADDFDNACDRLSAAVDSVQFERIRWSRTEGPMLEALAALLRSALGEREEFELSEEGSSGRRRRFVLKVHTFRIVAVNIALDGRQVTVWGETIERGRGRVANAQGRTAAYETVDEAWMKRALAAVFSEIEAEGRSPA